MTSIVWQPRMSGRLRESSSRLLAPAVRESIGRYNSACANVNASPKRRAVISQRHPCPKDSNETQSFSADVDYDELVKSTRESSSSSSSLLPRESIKEQSRVDVSNYGFDGSLPKGCGEDVAFNEDDLLGNNLQAINNAERSVPGGASLRNIRCRCSGRARVDGQEWRPQQRRTYQSKFTRTPRPWASRLLLCFGFQCPNR